MYNADWKIEFIRSYTESINVANRTKMVFEKTAQYENELGLDICQFSVEDLERLLKMVSGVKDRSADTIVLLLRKYAKWCLDNRKPGASNAIESVYTDGFEAIRRRMVSGPLHLQRYLDGVFKPESDQTIDNVYRCFYWLAFSGVPEVDSVSILAHDIDFENMCIHYKGQDLPIYREAIPALKNAAFLDEFIHIRDRYTTAIKRTNSGTLLRGVKSDTTISTLRNKVSVYSRNAYESGKVGVRVSYKTALTSGVFYREYERERAGFTPDFSWITKASMDGKSYALAKEKQLEIIKRRYSIDYNRWKIAFSI